MGGTRKIVRSRTTRGHVELMAALVMALLLLVLLQSPDLASAQSAQVATAQNAIGVLVVVRPDGIEDRLQAKGSLQLFEMSCGQSPQARP